MKFEYNYNYIFITCTGTTVTHVLLILGNKKVCVIMGLTSPFDNIICTKHKAVINATSKTQPLNLRCLKEARNLLTRRKIIKGHLIIKLRKKIMQPPYTPYSHRSCSKQLITTTVPIPTNTIVTACYPYQQGCNYPITVNDWRHLYTSLLGGRPVPIVIPSSSPIFTPHLTPVLTVPVVQPLLSPILAPSIFQDDIGSTSIFLNECSYTPKPIEGVAKITNEHIYFKPEEVVDLTPTTTLNIANTSIQVQTNQCDPIESYLKLPKDLFPTPSMLAIDPNPIIDEFCKMPNLLSHMPWLLDLEFGIPKSPITRPIPTYNVKFNSINCKNAPDAIHPGFESCDPGFKSVLLFYYDCIVSAWYRGYMIMHCDRSVENFQSWLLLPMQVLGFCWP